MNDEQYREHCLAVLAGFAETLETRTRQLPDGHPLRELATSLRSLPTSPALLYDEGPALVARLFDTFPEFAPTFPRLLLWFFGGSCLHYMADEEIARYQQLDYLRAAASSRGERFDCAEFSPKPLNLQ